MGQPLWIEPVESDDEASAIASSSTMQHQQPNLASHASSAPANTNQRSARQPRPSMRSAASNRRRAVPSFAERRHARRHRGAIRRLTNFFTSRRNGYNGSSPLDRSLLGRIVYALSRGQIDRFTQMIREEVARRAGRNEEEMGGVASEQGVEGDVDDGEGEDGGSADATDGGSEDMMNFDSDEYEEDDEEDDEGGDEEDNAEDGVEDDEHDDAENGVEDDWEDSEDVYPPQLETPPPEEATLSDLLYHAYHTHPSSAHKIAALINDCWVFASIGLGHDLDMFGRSRDMLVECGSPDVRITYQKQLKRRIEYAAIDWIKDLEFVEDSVRECDVMRRVDEKYREWAQACIRFMRRDGIYNARNGLRSCVTMLLVGESEASRFERYIGRLTRWLRSSFSDDWEVVERERSAFKDDGENLLPIVAAQTRLRVMKECANVKRMSVWWRHRYTAAMRGVPNSVVGQARSVNVEDRLWVRLGAYEYVGEEELHSDGMVELAAMELAFMEEVGRRGEERENGDDWKEDLEELTVDLINLDKEAREREIERRNGVRMQ